MESAAERLQRDWLLIEDDRAERELWSMSQERRDRLYSPELIGRTKNEEEISNKYSSTYTSKY